MQTIKRNLSQILSANLSIGKLLKPTNKSCPERNSILGDHFFRYALRLKLYSDAVNNGCEINTHELEMQSQNLTKKLHFDEVRSSVPIVLPSTGKQLPDSVNSCLNKWRQNAIDEVQSLNRAWPDEVVFETVKRINHSLIGWYLQNYGMQNALDIIQWMGVNLFTASENYKWSLRKPLLKEDNEETRRQLDQMLDGYDDLEEKIKYRFQNKAYLLQAVSDKSFTSNDLTADYKGLDFAGDAVLNYVTVRHLFRQPQYLSADDLKNVAILLYCNSSLATVSARNEMHKYLRYTTPEIRNNINSFVSFLRRNKFRPVDDLYFLDRKNFVFEVPPIIPSSFEALIGAIFLDSNMDLNAVSNTLVNLMEWDIKRMCSAKPKNAYIQLGELDASAEFSAPKTVASGQIKVTVTLPKHENQQFSGVSRDAQLAKWSAAKSAVVQLKKQRNSFIPVRQKEMFEKYQ